MALQDLLKKKKKEYLDAHGIPVISMYKVHSPQVTLSSELSSLTFFFFLSPTVLVK